jgi:3-phenylpropionate/trans-cinnamate dioxygenase ferredoxin subunit
MASLFVKVGRVAELPPGSRKEVLIDEQPVLLLNVDGEIYAIDDLCTHDDGPLGEGPLVGFDIECPRHGARFDIRTGQVRRMPAVEPIRVHEVKIENGDIYVRLRED